MSCLYNSEGERPTDTWIWLLSERSGAVSIDLCCCVSVAYLSGNSWIKDFCQAVFYYLAGTNLNALASPKKL